MKNIKLLFFIVIFLANSVAIAAPPAAPMNCKCHSKNPGMRRMHNMIGFVNCGNCHTKDEQLMKRKTAAEKEAAYKKMKVRFKEDSFCLPCHNSDGTVKKESYKNLESMKIIDTFYCPKDKLRFPAGTPKCTKCGGNLININALMEESNKSPSNKICQQCHLNEDMLKIEGHKSPTNEANDKLNNCLTCHKGHDDCGSCHH